MTHIVASELGRRGHADPVAEAGESNEIVLVDGRDRRRLEPVADRYG